MGSVGVPPIHFDHRDFTTPEGAATVNDWLQKVTLAINTLYGFHGTIPLQNAIDMNGNSITNLAAPVALTDAVHLAAAQAAFGPDVVQAAMEVTGNQILQTVRQLNNPFQREQYSSFLNDVMNTAPSSNSSVITVVPSGGNTVITVPAGTYLWGDGSSVTYAQRVDTIPSPGAQQWYFYYLRKADSTVQFTGPFAANTSQNQLTANGDGQGFIGIAQITGGGGGFGSGGGGGTGKGGCLEIGTPLSIPQGKKWAVEIEACADWIVIKFADGRTIKAARDTRIAIFKKVQDLDAGELAVLEDGQFVAVESIEENSEQSLKMKMRVEGRVYYGDGVLFSNWKPITS